MPVALPPTLYLLFLLHSFREVKYFCRILSYLSAKLWWVNQENVFDHKLIVCERDTSPGCPVPPWSALNCDGRGWRSKTRICFLYLNISMMKMEILTSRKFDKILIYFKMFTFLNNLYFLLCYVAKTFCPSKNISQLSEWQVSTLNCPICK